MKKFFNVIRRNIFYIALIAGMAALIALVTLYNMKMKSKDEENEINISQQAEENQSSDNSEKTDTANQGSSAEETISGGAAAAQNEDSTDTPSDAEGNSTSEDAAETAANQGQADTSEASETEEDQADLDFDGSQGLIWPINGNVIIPFSMDTTVYFETLNQYKCNPGMVIEATTGDAIYAVYKCSITEIYSDAEFGNVVKASLGNGYEIMYGQLQDVSVTTGQVVEAGTVIGTVGEPTRYYTEEGTNLYFAITKDGVPVNPMSLID